LSAAGYWQRSGASGLRHWETPLGGVKPQDRAQDHGPARGVTAGRFPGSPCGRRQQAKRRRWPPWRPRAIRPKAVLLDVATTLRGARATNDYEARRRKLPTDGSLPGEKNKPFQCINDRACRQFSCGARLILVSGRSAAEEIGGRGSPRRTARVRCSWVACGERTASPSISATSGLITRP